MRRDIVFTITIENTRDYMTFSCDTIKALMATCKLCNQNSDIIMRYNKYKAEHLFDMFHDKMISLALEETTSDTSKKLIAYIDQQNAIVKDWTYKLIRCEYLEYTYMRIFYRLEKLEKRIHNAYKMHIDKDKIKNYVHEEECYLFQDDCHYYIFVKYLYMILDADELN